MKEQIENNGFIKHNNIKIENLTEGILKVEIKEEHLNPYDIVHGGMLYTLADTAMGISLIDIGTFVTINASINYLKPAKCKELITKVERVKVGKTIAVLNCNIYDENNNLLVTSTGTYNKININK